MSFTMAESVASSSRDSPNTTPSLKMKCSFTLRSRNHSWIKTGLVNCVVIDSNTPFEHCLNLLDDQKQILGSYRGTNTNIQVPKDFKLVSRNHIAFIASQDQLYLYEDKAKYGVALDGVIARQGVLYPVEVGSRVTLSPNCKAAGTAFDFVVEEIKFDKTMRVSFSSFVKSITEDSSLGITTDDFLDSNKFEEPSNESIDLEDEDVVDSRETINLVDDEDEEEDNGPIQGRFMNNSPRPSVSQSDSIDDNEPSLGQAMINNERHYSEDMDLFEVDEEEEEEDEEEEDEEEEDEEEEDELEELEEETSSSTSVVEETSTSTVEATSTPVVQTTTAPVEATPTVQATPVVQTTSTAVQTTSTYESQTPEELEEPEKPIEIPAQLPQSRKRTRDEFERNEDEDVDTRPAKKSTSGSRLGQIFTAVAAGMLVGSIGTVTALASMST